jgi:alkyl hydroperoxide reductase subunit D
MSAVEELSNTFPDAARDIRLNLQSVLQAETLTPAQRWGVAIACAVASRSSRLRDALLADGRETAGDAAVDDAFAAAALMAMNNIFYRFRHMIGKESYAQKPARLRMQRIARPASNKADFELFCLAVSVINGCESCMRAHEGVVVEKGLTEDQVQDAVRIAATIHAAAVALELA